VKRRSSRKSYFHADPGCARLVMGELARQCHVRSRRRAGAHIEPDARRRLGRTPAFACCARWSAPPCRSRRWPTAEEVRYNQRSSAERVNARLKDEFGARNPWVRGDAKVFCHLMFGVLALSIDQLMRLVT
jgi:hypothetical protein